MVPKIVKEEMEKFYNTNENFKMYVDKYCTKHKLTTDIALEHLLVKYAYIDFMEKAKKTQVKEPEIKTEKIFDEDKAC